MRYIVLGENKTPSEKLSKGGHDLAEVKHFANLGVLVPEPYVIFDFDTQTDAEIMQKIAEGENLNCLIMQTTRGKHFWFKSPEPLKNSVKAKCAIGLRYDVRSYGKLSYVMVKCEGEWRKWIRRVEGKDVATVPKWLMALGSKYNFKNMKDGDGRNAALFEYILVLQKRGFTKEEVRETLRIINTYVFANPLSTNELEVILRDESFLEGDDLDQALTLSECFGMEGDFKHNKFSELLINKLSLLTVHEQTYVYKDGYYQRAERDIDKEMVRLYPSIRRSQRMEVSDYIKILTSRRAEDLPREEYVLNLVNGRLDLRTRELGDFNPNIPEFSHVPVSYDPNAYNADLDKMLDKVFCYDEEVRNLFEEMVGYLLIKNCRFRKGFLLYGSGSNGKSTVLNMLKAFLGDDNIATVELQKLNDPFLTAELENKLANIGDDIDARDIKDTGTIKKLFTGESLTVQRKYQDPFSMRSYAKLIFSCNELPRIFDKSQGMYNRLTFIPFQARFSTVDPDYDPFIENKITTANALSYLLNLGLRGLDRLLANNRFTEPTLVLSALSDYRYINSTVLTWVKEDSIPVHYLLEHHTERLFSDFQDWCKRYDVRFQSGLRTFHKEIAEEFNFTRRRIRNQETGGQYKWVFVSNDEKVADVKRA